MDILKKEWKRLQHLTNVEIAEKFGVDESTVRRYIKKFGLTREKVPLNVQIDDDRKTRAERVEFEGLRKKYQTLLDQHDRIVAERDAVLSISESTTVFPIKPRFGSSKSEAVAVAVASDWHVEEIVNPKSVGGRNQYSPEIAKVRARQFFERIERLVRKERQDVEIKELILPLLGDFISGNIHEELLENCAMPPVEATMYAQTLLQSGIEFLLAHTDLRLTIPCHVGNHSRITRKTHISTEQGNSLEYYLYGSLQGRFQGEKRVRFIIADGYHTVLPIYGFKMRLHHGHSVKYGGGVGGLTIPLNKAIHQWNLTEMVNWDVLGHFHEHINMHRAVVNGSLIGHNAFAVAIKAEYQPPTQAFFLIDKARGKTVSIPILFGD